jgi:TolB-like protein/Flp pilus assembly protein TadD
MKIDNFFAELKRRNVYKVAVAYSVVAWLLIQAASILFPTFEAPSWVMKVFVAIVLLGFPLALLFAWAFELTPEGIKRTEEVAPQQSISRKTGRKLIAFTAALAVVALALLVFQVVRPRGGARVSSPPAATASPSSAAAIPEKSIAVLPFENLSRDPDNAFFASGIQDEILTALAKISGLKVISRKSTARYESSPENLPEIARQLGVAHILEGSVQKAADKVHINLQLIRAGTDAHVWAQTYDRSLADIFAVEAEVARSVAEELKAKLTPEERARVETKPTEDSDAYVLYLRAKEYASRPGDLLGEEQMAVDLYTKAIALDPTFALARAHLSQVLSHIYLDFQPTDAIASRARAEAEESLRLQPDLGEGHWALALYLYWTQKDYETALRELEIAGKLLPNEGEIQADVAYIRRRQGRWRDALHMLNQTIGRDPRNASIAHEYFRTLCFVRDWVNAVPAAERAVALAPDSPVVIVDARYVNFWSKGDLEPLQAALAALPPTVDPDGFVTVTRCDIALLARNFAAAEAAVTSRGDRVIISTLGVPSPTKYLLGCIALARGDATRARILFEEVRPHFESQAAANPLDSFRHAQLGLVYAYLGRKEDAIREGQRAVELTPETRDALAGVIFSCVLAKIYAQVGEADQAIALIERLLITPGPVSYNGEGSLTLHELRRRWQWDPLRKDLRFQKILAGPEPKTNYN